MAELKTKVHAGDVHAFLRRAAKGERHADCLAVLAMMEAATKAPPMMWGTSIVGFGSYRYKYQSGREGSWLLTGFSPRKQNLTLYIMAGFDKYEALLKKLGKFKTGKSCLYLNRLSDIDSKVLSQLIRESVRHLKAGERAQA